MSLGKRIVARMDGFAGGESLVKVAVDLVVLVEKVEKMVFMLAQRPFTLVLMMTHL